MENNTFPETRKTLTELKDTVVDASRDLKSTAAVHAEKVKSQLSDLADNVQEETPDQLNLVRNGLMDVVTSGLELVSARPAASIGIALGIGLIIGFLSRPGSSRD
jgi:ElaB/YqjD/DUF883 family membrane-anchored ribosome-binding protein